ncbi:MerR family transcriptional regulator [Mucilaginibacter auburnensis]|uniref:DNA-binding transcriptional MerR regulator n=1 Tax=Mucilaginibacter auburnensis TaxID=1457233 RepID=A0A2H9VLU7_9SPHI|nr:MerR family transcriptional regulator [Mucilaginibacter auburnensis]PJJ79296.1 DNA-binding transcriptional MerR regulator [Mucilaginibacter auburnensis]
MNYSISDLEKLSGISVHNIRIWERRYGALKPSRTAGNTRFYDDEQLKRLLSITGLYHSGHKISRVCSLSNSDMSQLLQLDIDSTVAAQHRHEYFITQIINSCLVYNEKKLSELISSSFGQDGILNTYKFVIYPLLVRIGLLWLNGKVSPSQEHFLSQIIRQKLFAATDSCAVVDNTTKGWLLFLPEDEDHDIPLLLANYLLRAAGQRVIYLGPRVPLDTLHDAVSVTKPEFLLLFMTRMRLPAEAQTYLNSLSSQLKGVTIYLSGNLKIMHAVNLPENIKLLENPADFESIIKNKRTV